MDIRNMDYQTVVLMPIYRPRRPFILRSLVQLLMKWFLVLIGTLKVMIIALLVKHELYEDPEANETMLMVTDSVVAFCGLFGFILLTYFTMIYHARRDWKKATREGLPHFHESLGTERRCPLEYVDGYGNHPSVFIRMNDEEAPPS